MNELVFDNLFGLGNIFYILKLLQISFFSNLTLFFTVLLHFTIVTISLLLKVLGIDFSCNTYNIMKFIKLKNNQK